MDGLAAVATAYVIDIAGMALGRAGHNTDPLADPLATADDIRWHRILVRADDARALYLALDDMFGGVR